LQAEGDTSMTTEESEDIKRHFDVVAEGLESRIQLVTEGVSLVNERVDRLGDRLDSRMDRLETEMRHGFAELDGRMDRLETETRHGFAELRSMIKLSYAELENRLARLETAYDTIQERLAVLEARQAS